MTIVLLGTVKFGTYDLRLQLFDSFNNVLRPLAECFDITTHGVGKNLIRAIKLEIEQSQ